MWYKSDLNKLERVMRRWFSVRPRVVMLAVGAVLLAGSGIFVGFGLADTDYFFKINKSIDIFGRVYKEVTLNYVDEVDPEKFMEAGIDRSEDRRVGKEC